MADGWTRRGFLRTLICAGTALALPVLPAFAAEPIPRIYGDGVHDDSEGFRALFAGEPFVTDIPGFRRAGDTVYIGHGTYCLPLRLA